MPDPSFQPIVPRSIGPVSPAPGARSPSAAIPTGGPSFGSELSQALGEESGGENPMPVQATDQRLNELRADLNQIRHRATQLQAFQAHAAQLYQQQMTGNG